jgi:ATP-dependent RNA helicase RhlE
MSFSGLDLHADLVRSVTELGFTSPTPIQREAIPPALSGRDLLACAATGSGKTAAFLLPILHRLQGESRGQTRVLVLTPTRELAAQIADHLKDLARHTKLRGAAVFGGVGMKPQEAAFRRGVDFLIATPGRLLDHFQYPYARLDGLEYLVIDEADRMLDMGFLPDIRRIMRHIPSERQTLFFSATMPAPIVKLSRELLRDPVTINIERESRPAAGITQAVYPVAQELKTSLLLELLQREEIGSAIVFTRTKHRANRLAEFLGRHDISAVRIHGNRSQAQRTEALAGFKSGKYQILVATDIAQRGIDVVDLEHVVNFDVPAVAEDYIHRVGRTARAEATGYAFTFVSPEEENDLRSIERALRAQLRRVTIEGFDYKRRPTERLEVPLKERIAAIRAQRSKERERARAKADERARREGESGDRPAQGSRSGQSGRSGRPGRRRRRSGG